MIYNFRGDYGWLSNLATVDIVFEGGFYPSVENAYQAAKTLDKNMRKMFEDVSPVSAKKMGRRVVLRDDWMKQRLPIMNHLVLQKFMHGRFEEKLLATDDQEIVEGNNWGDTFWGECNGIGENNLGKILMNVREMIR